MSKRDYIPQTDARLLEWAQFLFTYATTNAARMKIFPPSGDLSDLVETFELRLQQTSSPNRGKVDIIQKNDARKALIKEFRVFVQGFLAKNPNVTNADRESMGITIYDTTPTAVPPPTMPAEADLLFPATAMVKVANIRQLGGSSDRRSDYGVRIYYGVMGQPDETDRFRMSKRPEAGGDLPHSVFTRRKSYRFHFPRSSGKEIFFCLRYENSKGETGPWGNMISAFIP
jgi:hypothetical protein